MTNKKECNHLTIHNTLCKYCGRLQCDLCKKEHKQMHVENNDKELSSEELEGE